MNFLCFVAIASILERGLHYYVLARWPRSGHLICLVHSHVDDFAEAYDQRCTEIKGVLEAVACDAAEVRDHALVVDVRARSPQQGVAQQPIIGAA